MCVFFYLCSLHNSYAQENNSYTHYESSMLFRLSNIHLQWAQLSMLYKTACYFFFFFLRVVTFNFFFSAVLRLNSYKNYFELFLKYFINDNNHFDISAVDCNTSMTLVSVFLNTDYNWKIN
jgi:hypothetical protein